MMGLYHHWTQAFPPVPAFTEKDLPDLQGKVYIVTGSNTGLGKELANILFSKNAKVYVAARSEEKAAKAIESIKNAHPSSSGELVYLPLDLNDLTTIKASANAFLAKERKLHVLFNNAGVMTPPQGSKTAQGYELQLGVNTVAPFLFTKFLTPTLLSTAKAEPPNTVRVVWVSSCGAELLSPKLGVPLDNLDYHNDQSASYKYGVSKAGNYLHACEFAKRYSGNGIVSVALNPGNLLSELSRHRGFLLRQMMRATHYPPLFGAYTELFAGLSPEVTIERSGHWIVPWNRFLPMRQDLADATKTEAEGGNGTGLKFWEWTEKQVKPYL
ncbi:hypothetical protein FQN53_003676 [Emmonsiellopsis sp. PD_33]|nr:hypothetical protein FQN53_003676 [Emmonsiellopsis sp. PD_33]